MTDASGEEEEEENDDDESESLTEREELLVRCEIQRTHFPARDAWKVTHRRLFDRSIGTS
jgi:hypothetical protein